MDMMGREAPRSRHAHPPTQWALMDVAKLARNTCNAYICNAPKFKLHHGEMAGHGMRCLASDVWAMAWIGPPIGGLAAKGAGLTCNNMLSLAVCSCILCVFVYGMVLFCKWNDEVAISCNNACYPMEFSNILLVGIKSCSRMPDFRNSN